MLSLLCLFFVNKSLVFCFGVFFFVLHFPVVLGVKLGCLFDAFIVSLGQIVFL